MEIKNCDGDWSGATSGSKGRRRAFAPIRFGSLAFRLLRRAAAVGVLAAFSSGAAAAAVSLAVLDESLRAFDLA